MLIKTLINYHLLGIQTISSNLLSYTLRKLLQKHLLWNKERKKYIQKLKLNQNYVCLLIHFWLNGSVKMYIEIIVHSVIWQGNYFFPQNQSKFWYFIHATFSTYHPFMTYSSKNHFTWLLILILQFFFPLRNRNLIKIEEIRIISHLKSAVNIKRTTAHISI